MRKSYHIRGLFALAWALGVGLHAQQPVEIRDSSNGPASVKPAIGTSTVPPTYTTAGATNANPSVTTTVSPNSGLPAIIQSVTSSPSGSQTTLSTSNFSTNPTAGNSLVCVVGVGNGSNPGCSDTIGNAFTLDLCTASSTTFETCFFHSTNISGGATDACTVTPSASVSVAIACFEVSGIIGAGGGGSTTTTPSTVNQQNTVDLVVGSTGSSTSPASSAGTNTYANELAFGAIAIGTANQTPSAFTPWTKQYDIAVGGTPSGLYGLHVFSQPLGAPGASVSLSATITSEPWAAALVVYKPAGIINIADKYGPTTSSGVAFAAAPYTTNATSTSTYTNVKATGGNFYGADYNNPNTAVCWLQFYNSVAPTVGTSVIFAIPLYSNGTNGAGYDRPPFPVNFSTAISIATTTTATGSTECSTGIGLTIYYQ